MGHKIDWIIPCIEVPLPKAFQKSTTFWKISRSVTNAFRFVLHFAGRAAALCFWQSIKVVHSEYRVLEHSRRSQVRSLRGSTSSKSNRRCKTTGLYLLAPHRPIITPGLPLSPRFSEWVNTSKEISSEDFAYWAIMHQVAVV